MKQAELHGCYTSMKLLFSLAYRRSAYLASINRLLAPDNPQAVNKLVALLRDEDPTIRVAAANALGQRGDQRALAALLRALYDPDACVRRAAASALGWLGDSRAVPYLINLLIDTPDEETHVSVVMSLQWIGDPFATTGLLQSMQFVNRMVRDMAKGVVLQFGQQAIPYLIPALNSSDRGTRRTAAEVLVRCGADAVPALIDVLSHPDADARQVATRALVEIGSDAISDLQQALCDTENREKRLAARNALSMIGEEAIPALVEALKSSEDVIYEDAAWALTVIGQPAARRLNEVLAQSPNGNRGAITRALERIAQQKMVAVSDS